MLAGPQGINCASRRSRIRKSDLCTLIYESGVSIYLPFVDMVSLTSVGSTSP